MAHAADLPRTVVSVRWPSETARRDELARLDQPRLLVLDDGALPPEDLDPFEDWVLGTTDPHEVELRAEVLARRAERSRRPRPALGDDDILRFGGAWVALSPRERRVTGLLVDHFESCVSRAALARADGDEAGRASLNSVIKRLRLRLAPLGLTVNNVHGRGYVLADRAFDR